MKITHFDIFRYALPLTSPLSVREQSLSLRSGWIIRLTDENNHTGLGEVAPLPGLHSETPEDALFQIKQLRQTVRNAPLPDDLEKLNGAFRRWLGEHLHPTVRFGMETAVLNLLSERFSRPLPRLLSEKPTPRVLVNGLLSGSGKTLTRQLSTLQSQGYQAVKLKVGRVTVQQDIEMVRFVRSALPSSVSLRLDANRAWELTTAIEFAKGIEGVKVEYIEEPLIHPEDIKSFYEATGMPVALDESVSELTVEWYQPIDGVVAFILKPAVLGGFEETIRLGKLASRHHLKAVVSSTFHTGIGFTAEVCLAASVSRDNVPAGLGTSQWLKQDLLTDPIPIEKGSIDVFRLYRQSGRIRRDLLRRENPEL